MARTKPGAVASWADFRPDMLNANEGTPHGMSLLRKSLQENGIGKPPVIDAAGNIVSGNKTAEIAAELGFSVRVVDVAPDEVVMLRRNDLDLYGSDPTARNLATAENAVASQNLSWLDDMLQRAADMGSTAREDYFTPWESEAIAVQGAKDAAAADGELPPQEPLDAKPKRTRRVVVLVTCADENEQADVTDFCESRGITWRIL